MKHILLVAGLFLLASGVFAQSLENNEYYTKSVEYANMSQTSMDEADYDAAAEYAIESQRYAALSRQFIEDALAAARNSSVLATEYEVKRNPARRDCLWRIAGYDFIYGNSKEWRRIYEHNKSTFRYPDNPNLIYPGQILKIPSIKEEIRRGRR